MITIDYGNTNKIFVPQSSLILVSGTLYKQDTNAFRLELKSIEESEEGIVFPDTNVHNTEVTVAGTTFARTLEIKNPYSIEYENLQYAVRLEGSNNNMFDIENGILVQNQVQVIPTNSAGLIVSGNTGGGGTSVWSESEKDKVIQDSEDAKTQATIAAMNSQTVKQI